MLMIVPGVRAGAPVTGVAGLFSKYLYIPIYTTDQAQYARPSPDKTPTRVSIHYAEYEHPPLVCFEGNALHYSVRLYSYAITPDIGPDNDVIRTLCARLKDLLVSANAVVHHI